VVQGHADLAIATESLALTPGLVTLPCYVWEHTLVVRPDHPLANLKSSAAKKLTLAQLAEYPIVTYEPAFAGRTTIDEVFAAQGVHPDIVLEATDADVIKTYVDVGMGVGIVAGVAYDPRRDRNLVGIPVGRLFGAHTTRVGLKEDSFLRDYVLTFLEMLAPTLTREVVQTAMVAGRG